MRKAIIIIMAFIMVISMSTSVLADRTTGNQVGEGTVRILPVEPPVTTPAPAEGNRHNSQRRQNRETRILIQVNNNDVNAPSIGQTIIGVGEAIRFRCVSVLPHNVRVQRSWVIEPADGTRGRLVGRGGRVHFYTEGTFNVRLTVTNARTGEVIGTTGSLVNVTGRARTPRTRK